MAQPIYKLFIFKYKESWYKLTDEERNTLMQKHDEIEKQLDIESIIMCLSRWSSEEWSAWGVEKYPNIEAVQKHAQDLSKLNWYEYFESKSYLGTEYTP